MTSPAEASLKGYALGLGYVAFVSASTIFLNHVGQEIPALTMLFYTALSSMLVFNLWEARNGARNHRAILSGRWLWLGMSAALVGVWGLSYYSAIESAADFFLPVYFLSAALSSSLAGRRPLKVAACVASIALIYAFSPEAHALVLLTSIGAGASAYAYFSWSYAFAQTTGMSVLGVISIRFYLLFLFTLVACLWRGGVDALLLSRDQLLMAAALSCSNMIFPVLLSQSSLQLLGPARFTFLTTLIPVVTFLLQATGDGIWPVGLFAACLITTVALNLDPLLQLARRPRAAAEAGAESP